MCYVNKRSELHLFFVDAFDRWSSKKKKKKVVQKAANHFAWINITWLEVGYIIPISQSLWLLPNKFRWYFYKKQMREKRFVFTLYCIVIDGHWACYGSPAARVLAVILVQLHLWERMREKHGLLFSFPACSSWRISDLIVILHYFYVSTSFNGYKHASDSDTGGHRQIPFIGERLM